MEETEAVAESAAGKARVPVDFIPWDISFLGNDLRQWLTALLFVSGGFAAAFLFSSIINKIIKKAASRTKTVVDDIIAEYISVPITLFFILAGISLGFSELNFSEKAAFWKSKIFFAIIVCVVSWSIMKMIDALIMRWRPKYMPASQNDESGGNGLLLQPDFKPVLRRLISIIMVLIPAGIIARSFGHDISAVLTGLGIGGAALAFAVRDILSSFFGSIAVLSDKPFHVGDRIRFRDKNYENIDGFIVEIRFRTTRLQTLDNRMVTIPNNIFSLQPVENISSEPHTRVMQTIMIRSSNGSAKVERALAILKSLAPEGALFGAPHQVSLTSVGAAFHKITFIFFIAKGSDYFGTISAVNTEILRLFEESSIEY